ncbi:MAG: hypothetical protein BA863_18275 [Desulfovibrio sp. S3730MH75]|nr:MAG: hypothetical protein BA863_18275 [Desulfovibrio sp. S3730MH75]
MKEKSYDLLFSGFKGVESDLIPILLRIQEKDGYISKESVKRISKFLRFSENQIYGVASFYSKFRFTEPGKNSIKVCMGTACHVHGGKFSSEAFEWQFGVSFGQKTADSKFDLQQVNCMGCCTLAPVIQINDDIYGRTMVTGLKEILKKYE